MRPRLAGKVALLIAAAGACASHRAGILQHDGVVTGLPAEPEVA